jgi:hypothetical protein
MMSKIKILSLYKNLLRSSKRFVDYNIKSYSLQKIKYEFRKNKEEIDESIINNLYLDGEKNLQIINRQGFFYYFI